MNDKTKLTEHRPAVRQWIGATRTLKAWQGGKTK